MRNEQRSFVLSASYPCRSRSSVSLNAPAKGFMTPNRSFFEALAPRVFLVLLSACSPSKSTVAPMAGEACTAAGPACFGPYNCVDGFCCEGTEGSNSCSSGCECCTGTVCYKSFCCVPPGASCAQDSDCCERNDGSCIAGKCSIPSFAVAQALMCSTGGACDPSNPKSKTAAHGYICLGEGVHCDGTTVPCCTDECSDQQGLPHDPNNPLRCDTQRGNPSATGNCVKAGATVPQGDPCGLAAWTEQIGDNTGALANYYGCIETDQQPNLCSGNIDSWVFNIPTDANGAYGSFTTSWLADCIQLNDPPATQINGPCPKLTADQSCNQTSFDVSTCTITFTALNGAGCDHTTAIVDLRAKAFKKPPSQTCTLCNYRNSTTNGGSGSISCTGAATVSGNPHFSGGSTCGG